MFVKEILDIDRIVRDQDVELLDIHTSNVTHCNLESEYDVKILDPNFIKLFKLAQLLIDFLLHCKRYLEHCIKTAHESLQISNKEVEGLRKQLIARKYEVKKLKKKLKEIKEQLLTSPSPRNQRSNFECSLCGKVFMNEMYLQGHHSRRHIVPPNPVAMKHLNHLPTSLKVDEQDAGKTKPEETHSIKKKYEGEIEELKTMFFAEIQKLKQNECSIKKEVCDAIQTNTNADMKIANENLEADKEKPNQSTSVVGEHIDIKENLSSSEGKNGTAKEILNTAKVAEEEWLRRLEEREGVWRARLTAVDQQYKKQVTELQDRLNTSRLEGQEMKKSLEDRLEEVLTKFEQTQMLLANKTTIPQDDNNHHMINNKKEMQTSKTENKSASKVNLVKNIPKKNQNEILPFQKRKAFVSQKSKTIQDEVSFDSFITKEPSINLSKILEPDENDSDSENIPPESTSKKISTNVLDKKKLPSFVEVLGNSSSRSGVNSNSSNSKESIITQLLDEERLKSSTSEMFAKEHIVPEDESSVSETCSETESESESSVEEKTIETKFEDRDLKQTSEFSDNHLLLVETQLAEQSLKSMESLLASNPDILCQLREDLTQLCSRRLQSLGVDPSWNRLPPATFQTKMAVLTHQRNITAKNHKVYFTLRDKLSEDADEAVHCRPTQSTADSVLARLRNKATQIINAVKFSHQIKLGTLRKKGSKPNSFQLKDQPLASSSPQYSPLPPSSANVSAKKKIPFVIPEIHSTPPKDSSSMSLSTTDDDDDDDDGTEKTGVANVTYTEVRATPGSSYKSALRNALSTGNLAKKKVLFVDEAITEDKRSQSETTVATLDSSMNQSDKASSIASLVHEIQLQLSQRSGKLPLSIDLMKPQDTTLSTGNLLGLPLSQILPLSKSGRELLESQEKLHSNVATYSAQSSTPALSPLKTSAKNGSLNNTLEKVPNPNLLATVGKKSEFLESPRELKKASSKTVLEPLKVSPVHSLTSIGSSLLDVSVSPRGVQGSLEWDLQDLEDNLRD